MLQLFKFLIYTWNISLKKQSNTLNFYIFFNKQHPLSIFFIKNLYLNKTYRFFLSKTKNNVPFFAKFYWLTKYLAFFLKNITALKINWQFINLKLTASNKSFIALWNKTYTRRLLKIFFCSGWFYFYLLLQLFFFKNISELCNFIAKVVQRQTLKYHKPLFQLTNLLFRRYLNILQPDKKLLGYRIYFKGKLGRKGSVKKSTIYFNGGRISFTNKCLRYNYKNFLIPTETGVVGCYVGIFY